MVRAGTSKAEPSGYPVRDEHAPGLTLKMVKWFVVHHTGVGAARPTVDDIAAFQTGPTAQADFPSIAYCMYVDGTGVLHLCHDLETVPWSNGDNSPTAIEGVGIYNWWTISCCFAGENPTNEQLVTMREAHRALEEVLGRSVTVKGHREVTGTSDTECPGDAAMTSLGYIGG